ncbi:MAG TPA: hypothetical protein DHV78_05810 [Alcanivorax sp.]|nr:hypothetical protein [Alcanivorax sp.]MAD72027.1 hypothetical protein [Alcanivorax sp.]HAI25712.1 hypothetical protein [Alcanivorax sp.]HBP75159.1 hypothetical protein [Alcanivorax sp.]HCI11113.1 hypothetical protein [Alcanivorax sp.]
MGARPGRAGRRRPRLAAYRPALPRGDPRVLHGLTGRGYCRALSMAMAASASGSCSLSRLAMPCWKK